ncbi:MAG: PGPGW domain-containing protein [Bacteroidota bacterium]
MIFKSLKQIKRVFVGIIGTTILIIGLAMIVLPGPAFIVIPLGLSILATEFLWARKIVERFKSKLEQLKKKK